jgi:hypothetical protein
MQGEPEIRVAALVSGGEAEWRKKCYEGRKMEMPRPEEAARAMGVHGGGYPWERREGKRGD